MPGEGANHDQSALAAVRTWLTSAKGRAPAIGRLARPCRGCGRRLRCVPRQRELELVEEGPMDGTPQPIVPDLVEALGQHMLQKASDELVGGQRHGLPALVLGILIAEADVAVLA